jgi:hypothetical protein
MGYAPGSLSQIYPKYPERESAASCGCYNLTFSAVSSTGAAVDLLIDDALSFVIVKG